MVNQQRLQELNEKGRQFGFKLQKSVVVQKAKKYLIVGTMLCGIMLQVSYGESNERKKEEMSFREFMEGMMGVADKICKEQNRYGNEEISIEELRKRVEGILKKTKEINIKKIRLYPKKKDMKVNIEDLKFIKDSSIENISTIINVLNNCISNKEEDACRKRAIIIKDCTLGKKEIDDLIDEYEGKK